MPSGVSPTKLLHGDKRAFWGLPQAYRRVAAYGLRFGDFF